MKSVEELMFQIWGYKSEPEYRILKEWAESIIEETRNYDWTETSWEEQKEQLRKIKWKL